MAGVLGQLLVELGINTAAFKDGLDKATFQAKAFAGDLKQSFGSLQSSLGALASSFGTLDPAMGAAIQGITSALGPLMESFGSVGGAAAGLSVAFAAVGVGALGIAEHFSETAARLEELSQSTGIAVEQLSLLGNVAETKGIGVDQMAKALEKMDKAALAAALSGPKSTNAFKELGIAVTNTDGSMRQAKEIFDDVSAKFATMPDGPQKTAEAIKIFGRAGAEMIPLLNEGGSKIAELEDHFTKLNAVISGPTAEASSQLKENTTLMTAAFTGIENELTAELVPALNVAAQSFVEFFETNQDGIKGTVDGIAEIAKITLNVFQEIGLIFSLLYRVFYTAVDELQVLGGTLGNILGDVSKGNFGHIWQDVKDGSKDAASEMKLNFDAALDSISKTGASMVGVTTAGLPNAKKTATGQGNPLDKGGDISFIDKEVQALERKAAQEETMAQAVGQATESQIDANAAAESDLAIQKLRDEAAQKGIENTKAFKDALDAAIPKLQQAALWENTFKAAITDQGEFDKFTKKIGEQVAALQSEAEAGTTVERQWAKNNAMVKPLADSLEQLGLKYEELRVQYGDQDKRVQDLGAKVASLNAQYQQEVAAVGKLNEAFQKSQAQAEAKKLDDEIIKIKGNIAALKGGDSFLNIAQEVQLLARDLGLTNVQMDALKKKMEELRQLQIQAATLDAAKSAGFDPKKANDLNQEIQYLKQNWKDLGLSAEQYSKTLAQLEAQYADLEAESGGFTSGIKAGFKDFSASIQSDGQLMREVTSSAFKGISDNLASAVATGKAKWGDLVNSMEEMLLKSAINNILKSLFNSIGNALSGSSNGFLSGIGGLFGGGHAEGGDVTPGKTYLVGEKGPELLKIGAAGGSVIPNGQFGAQRGGNVTVVQNIQTPDVDGFKRSQAQIHASAYKAASSKYARMNQ